LKPWQELQSFEEQEEDTIRGKSAFGAIKKSPALEETCQLINSLGPGAGTS